MTDQPRMVRIATLWQRKSAKTDKTYFAGFMGDCQVLLFDGGRQPHPNRPEEQVHIWRLFVQERNPARRPRRRDAEPAPPPEPDQDPELG